MRTRPTGTSSKRKPSSPRSSEASKKASATPTTKSSRKARSEPATPFPVVMEALQDDSTIAGSGRAPHVRVDAVFVEYGYQVDIWVCSPKGTKLRHIGTLCRDFGGNHAITKLIGRFVAHQEKMLDEFREKL